MKRFLHEKSDDRFKIVMTIDDVEHYSEDEKKKIISSYPAHEMEARTKGIPILGSGRIFPVTEESIACEHRDFPPHWPHIGGWILVGTHPFAAVEFVWDRDSDIVYVSKAHRLKEATPVFTLRRSRDGEKSCHGHGQEMEGAKLLRAPASRLQNSIERKASICCTSMRNLKTEHFSVEAGLMDMLTRMQTGRFKVFKHLNDWWEEFRLYHRKDGKVVKEDDDLMAATRYALMMLRFASTKAAYDKFRRKIEYPRVSIA